MGETSGVQVVDRVFDIIECLSKNQKSMGPSEISALTGLHKSTVYRLLNSMHERGYIEKSAEDGKYRIGVKLIEVVSNHIDNLELHTEARPYLNELRTELNLTVHLGILDKHEVIYIEKIDTFPNLRLYSQIGFRVPAYCSSLGKCLLSRMAGSELEEIMNDCSFERFTENTITDIESLKMHLRDVRNRGWAVDDEEHFVGRRCIAAPIFDYRCDIIAAVSASGSSAALSKDRFSDIIRHVVATAKSISHRLGYMD